MSPTLRILAGLTTATSTPIIQVFLAQPFRSSGSHRQMELPRPVRTMDEPYAKKENTELEQEECDRGTVMACRSIDLARAVAERKGEARVKASATLENPPPSSQEGHLSAWELPEMGAFLTLDATNFAMFNTCNYEPDIPVLERSCTCEGGHGLIVGRAKYAKLLAAHLKLTLSPQLFAFCVLFMMREIELAAFTTTKAIKLDHKLRLVMVTWKELKMDQEGISVSRSLQCICPAQCGIDCPFAVAEVFLNTTTLKGAPGGHFTLDESGKLASKTDLVNDWVVLFNMKVTGHSTRRSGASQCIRQGWTAGYLGRWKSCDFAIRRGSAGDHRSQHSRQGRPSGRQRPAVV